MKKFFVLLMLALSVPGYGADLKVGDMAPDYIGREDGKAKMHLADYRGRFVIVTFFATWCAPCVAEIPVLENIQRQVSPDILKIVAVTYHENKETFKRIRRAFKDADMTLNFDGDNRVAQAFGVTAVPNMFIIDGEGRIVSIHKGYGEGTPQMLVDELNALLAGQAAE